jgi:hypothetical protein
MSVARIKASNQSYEVVDVVIPSDQVHDIIVHIKVAGYCHTGLQVPLVVDETAGAMDIRHAEALRYKLLAINSRKEAIGLASCLPDEARSTSSCVTPAPLSISLLRVLVRSDLSALGRTVVQIS